MPSSQPAPASDAEAARLAQAANARLHDGERAQLIARDLLLAGMRPSEVRRTLAGAAADVEVAEAARRQREAGFLFTGGILGVLLGLFTIRGKKQPVPPTERAEHALEQWTARFPEC